MRLEPCAEGRPCRWLGSVLLIVVTSMLLLPGSPVLGADGEQKRSIILGTHERVILNNDALRVAVGDPDLLSVETLTARELLVLGRMIGQTTLIVWYRDGSTETMRFTVRPDLTLLEEALRGIHESITVGMAPDRYAVVLQGLVPDISYSNAAEATAMQYLGAASRGARLAPTVRGTAGEGEAGAPAPATGGAPFGPAEAVQPTATVINLIKVTNLPDPIERRIELTVSETVAAEIRVERVLRGPLPDDAADVFVLTGEVPDQTALTRAIHVAAAVLLGRSAGGADSIEVIGDESGALRSRTGGSTGSSGGGGGMAAGGLTSGGGTTDNDIEANVARATALSAAGGRILSFLSVASLPQVRIDVRYYELNRSKLMAYSSDFTAIFGDVEQPSLLASGRAERVMGAAAPRVGEGAGGEFQDVLGYLAGQSTNEFQWSGSHMAVDAVLSALETRGIARSLSRPSLTVLSGETALFQVGGEIPVSESFAPTAEAGVFNSVSFRSFGIQLKVRPLVGKDGFITMDLTPQVSLPDMVLTAVVRESTGAPTGSTAFETRFLETTARLGDNESLVVGGLATHSTSLNVGQTPGLGEIPILGWLFGHYNQQEEVRDLVVVVRPVILREQSRMARLWAFPSPRELVLGRTPAAPTTEAAASPAAPAETGSTESTPTSEADPAGAAGTAPVVGDEGSGSSDTGGK